MSLLRESTTMTPSFGGPPFVLIRTARLLLEPITEGHADEMFRVLADPSLYHYMPSEIPTSLVWLRERYRVLSRGLSPDASQLWLNWIVSRMEDRRAIGYVQATVPPSLDHALMGWTVGRATQGHGYARESVRAICSHLMRNGIAEVRATIDVRNAPSISVAESVGFVREATAMSEDVLDGIRGTDHHYVLRSLPS
ncbi:MAG: GNAT family N-acetyltransferase [Candidatus Eremiobacteraeota bacterium]|nr:GNAT family N-acetyltransferase [Candidatus Eremiobacteraeota bacterium]